MKCANCDNKASYEYRVTKNKSIFYCGKDLPRFLEERKKAGLLTITEQFTEDLTSALETLSSPVEEEHAETVEEEHAETVEEEHAETVEEEPKPKKKTLKSEE